MPMTDEEKMIAAKAKQVLEKQLSGKGSFSSGDISNPRLVSKEYDDFRKEELPGAFSLYEKACNYAVNLMKSTPDPKEVDKIKKNIETCHLNVTPDGVASLTTVGAMAVLLFALLLGVLFFAFSTVSGDSQGGMNLLVFFLIIGLIMALMAYMQLSKMPELLAQKWRMQGSNQMVICIFYIVTFMRHTSNLENALRFAAEHVGFPLSLDLKRVIWGVETGDYSSMSESLDAYLEDWKDHSPEFVDSMHLIESSLLQGSEDRRIQTLDNSLNNILEQTYEKMLHYAHDLQTPLSNLNMLGVILPVMGMVILPLVVSMMTVEWYYLLGIYNIVLFVLVYNLGNNVLATRPTGYGDSEMPSSAMEKFKTIDVNLGFTTLKLTPAQAGISVAVIFTLLALSPFIIHWVNPIFDTQAQLFISDISQVFGDMMEASGVQILDFRGASATKDARGPFGIGATVLSLFYTLAAGIGLGVYYKAKSSNVIKIREKAKTLEKEFTTALFQLSNRLGDGYPVEIAVAKAAQSLEGSISGDFFKRTSENIESQGMDIERAIFNKDNGSISLFPSSLIASTMKVLVESSKRGPKIAALAMNNVATYIKEIHKVDERLKDLMSETIQSMKSQIKMLTPLISAIVVGITSFIINILGSISKRTGQLTSDNQGASMAAMGDLFGEGIPVYFFQIVVGIYVVQIVYILTTIINGVENGSDKLAEQYQLGQNLIKSTLIYVMVSFASIFIFFVLGMTVMQP